MKKLSIIVDCDEILAHLLPAWLAEYNRKYGTNITLSQIEGWGIENFVPHGTEIFKILDTPRIFANLDPIPGGPETLKRLKDLGHEIMVCTASAKLPQIAADKLEWLRKTMPWLSQDDVFIGRKKYKLKADILIDDAPHNQIAYKEAWPNSHVLSIAYPYNRDTKDLVDLDAQDYTNTKFAWEQMEEYIMNISEH